MDATDVVMLSGMLLAWLGVLSAVVVPALVLDARNSAVAIKVERESRAYLSAR